MVGTHPVVFKTTAIVDVESGSYLPVVRKVKGEFVFVSFGVFGAEFVIAVSLRTLAAECRVQRVNGSGMEQLRVFLYTCHPLQGRRMIVQMIIPLINSQSKVVGAEAFA